MNSTRHATRWATCRCGCGGNTQATFVPGHDARLKGLVIRVTRGVMTLEDVGTWGGESVEIAVAKAMDDKAMMTRWNLTGEVAAYKAEVARLEAEAAAKAEETQVA